MVSPIIRQIWTVSGVLINMVSLGMVMAFPSSLLPALSNPDSPIHADLFAKSWIASSVGFSSLPGFVASSVLMGIYGRRNTQIIGILPGLLGWLLIYFATGVPTILIGRILTGYSAGASSILGAVVIGEYSSPTHRGTFLNLKTASICMGSMVTHILGHFLTWKVVALVSLVPWLLSLCITYTWPESPAWLASTQQYEMAKESFMCLRGNDEESMKELDDLIKSEFSNKKQHKTVKQTATYFFKKLTKKDFLKPLSISIAGCILLEASGRHIFPVYALDIMGEITGSKAQTFYCTLVIDVIITTSAAFSAFLARVMKRRTQLFGSGLASIVVLTSVCAYLFLASRGIVSNDNHCIPVSLFIIYSIVVNLGCTPIPLAFFGELMPLEHKGAGSTLAGITMSLAICAGLQVTPYLLLSVKVHGTFAVLGICMVVILLFLYFVLPECKDRTLEDIDFFFYNGRFREGDRGEIDEVKTKMLYKGSCE